MTFLIIRDNSNCSENCYTWNPIFGFCSCQSFYSLLFIVWTNRSKIFFYLIRLSSHLFHNGHNYSEDCFARLHWRPLYLFTEEQKNLHLVYEIFCNVVHDTRCFQNIVSRNGLWSSITWWCVFNKNFLCSKENIKNVMGIPRWLVTLETFTK